MITLKNVILRRSAKVLLDGASVTLNPGEKVGLVGRNGAGKSSLFALFNGGLHEDGGDFSIPRQWRMAQVAQDMPETDASATDFVVTGDTRLVELRDRLATLEAAYAANPDDGDIGMEMAHAYTDLADAGEHDAIPRAQALVLGLGFKSHELDAPVNSFSGGWRMRLQLARALMCPSDLLLLDEPTNHLDLDALVWLEAWLQKYQGTMIVISHDREFLDAVTDVTLHIEHAKLTRYGGNYSKFEDMRALQMEQQQQAYNKQQEKIAHLQKFIDRFKAKATKARQAQSRVKALERMEKVAPLLAEADFNFEFKEPGNIPNPMLSISGASFGYQVEGEAPKTILSGVNRSVQGGQRIGILGANGQGKSTLVKTIAREMGALAGTVTEGRGLNIGYFAQQELDVLRPQENPLQHMVRLARESPLAPREGSGEQALRSFLGGFNFSGDMVKQPVGTMSGGEKARLVLAMMVWQRPNLLLLDEPTNHLDLATREALAVALNEFEGTLLLVSHDRALLRSVCDEFWLVGRGAVSDFDGDLDDYQRYLLDEAKRQREEAKEAARDGASVAAAAADTSAARADSPAASAATSSAAPPPTRTASGKKPNRQLLEREIATVDAKLATAGTEKAALEASLSKGLAPADLAEAGRRLAAVNEEIEGLEERWMTLSGELEALTA